MSETTQERLALVHQMVDDLREGRIDEAERAYDLLQSAFPPARDFLIFPVLFAIQRGHFRDALLMIEERPDIEAGDLKALCLYLLKDPSWHGLASELAHNSPEPHVRDGMRLLLGEPAVA